VFSFFGRRKPETSRSASSTRKLVIPENIYRKMINHCQEERPLEACGLMVGAVDEVVAAYAADNEHRSPVVYKVDDQQLLQVFREIRNDKHEIIAIYHSHVNTEAVPSRTDIDQATWPEAYYLIVSLAQRTPKVRAWRLVDRQVTEYQVVVSPTVTGLWKDLRRAVQIPPDPQPRPESP
jgi:proteasome lid subunit RPN8/RPN11